MNVAYKIQEQQGVQALTENFADRHIGPGTADISRMLSALGKTALQDFVNDVVPAPLRLRTPLQLSAFPQALSESAALARIRELASRNRVFRSYIGLGYYNTFTPPVILRNIMENPGWYTQYTPYQPEISQGRLEALLNFQTMVCDLTALPIANASLLDEGTAAAEAMVLCHTQAQGERDTFLVCAECHPQTIAVVQTRAEALGFKLVVAPAAQARIDENCFGVLLQYPATCGALVDPTALIDAAHKAGALAVVATDLLALCLLKAPGEFGADVAVGSAQRFGVPLGFGGPHAAFFATKDEFKRSMPGRLVGLSKDRLGNTALRLALQTREQHIRREKATSNICTAQVLLAIMAAMYAVYHGPHGLKRIAQRVHRSASRLAAALRSKGIKVRSEQFFDTLSVDLTAPELAKVLARASEYQINLRVNADNSVGVSLDETVGEEDLALLTYVFCGERCAPPHLDRDQVAPLFLRQSAYLTNPVFNSYHSETEFLRYLRRLESRDLSLGTAMIPLGSCTMKLNATSEMIPVTWPEFGALHPFAPKEQTNGYLKLFDELQRSLAEITGFAAVSLQPNAGSQGEYAGLLAIRGYLDSRSEHGRTTCLIPRSAHGTNPASAVMAGFKVVVVECDAQGNIDLADLRKKSAENAATLGCLMATYPSTHGVFEEGIGEVCRIVHAAGGQVYMDGANLNALVGLVHPDQIGADVCHINLHKTFCIPHGGGGPGMGPIAVRQHLAPFLPGHPLVNQVERAAVGPVSAAPWGSASILPISWMYMAMMGAEGLTYATKIAILSANYVARRLEQHYPVLYKGAKGFVAHECILDLRPIEKSCGVKVEDVAKRLMDYGFHAPTVSFPVAGTIMIEPTESESRAELDRFCDAMIMIRKEIAEIEAGSADRENNLLKNAPHTASEVCGDKWNNPYSRERAAFPTGWTRQFKFWPAVARIDAAYGDKNLVCTCPDISSYT